MKLNQLKAKVYALASQSAGIKINTVQQLKRRVAGDYRRKSTWEHALFAFEARLAIAQCERGLEELDAIADAALAKYPLL